MSVRRDQRISDLHLSRKAIVYIRQSSPHQVKSNTESPRLQLSLRERAISFGWRDPLVIDDDLGISAAGYSNRPGFQRMLTMVTMKEVGVILCFDASRLSRNSKDWANLFELCGGFDTLVADLDQVYDLNLPNDRMVLGIKGTMAELELSIQKMRLKQGALQKARRGELKTILPPGYCHDHDDKIVFDPDVRVRQAIHLLFEQFEKHTSVRQLSHWYIENKIAFPVRKVRKNNPVVWEVPKYGTLKTLLQNPSYSGVYAYGRTRTTYEYEKKEGRLVKKTSDYLPPEQWRVCIKDHHEAYITWEAFLDNQKKISQNRPRWKKDENICAIREGLALLVGLLRCGHCGKKLYVSYKTDKHLNALYYCKGYQREGPKRCLSFGAHSVDKCVSMELLRALEPAAIEAGFIAIETIESENSEKSAMAKLDLRNAEYQAQRAFEQYDHVDPKHRLVADTLEQRLNDRLADLNQARQKVSELEKARRTLTENEKQSILDLSRNFKKIWLHEKADPVLKKELLRHVIKEIMVTHDVDAGMLHFIIHWHGGSHTKASVKKRKTPIGNKTDKSLIENVKKLATRLEDAEIARVLNMSGETTPAGLRWNKDRVSNFRRRHRIKQQKKDTSNVLTAEKAAEYLGVSRRALDKLVKVGLIDTNQVMSFAPWEIPRSTLESVEVQNAVKNLRNTGRLFPRNGYSKKQRSLFPDCSNKR